MSGIGSGYGGGYSSTGTTTTGITIGSGGGSGTSIGSGGGSGITIGSGGGGGFSGTGPIRGSGAAGSSAGRGSSRGVSLKPRTPIYSSSLPATTFGIFRRTTPTDLYKKIDTRGNNVTIVNTYPQEESRYVTQTDFLGGVRAAYIMRGSGSVSRGSGSGAGAGAGGNTVSHTATSINGGVHVNTVNERSKLFSIPNSNIKLPRPFGTVNRDYRAYELIERNLEGRDTSLRFFVRFETGNTYISKQLRIDLDAAAENGNPYFTSHLIPTINLNKAKLNDLKRRFQGIEKTWQFDGSYLPIVNSLGTEIGKDGEREIFKYIDSLLKSPPTGESPDFIAPYRKGTVIETSWFSQNDPGLGVETSDSNVDYGSLKGNAGETNVVTANTGEEITIVGDTLDKSLQEVADIAADVGSGNYDGTTTTGVLDADGDGTADSIANFADELEDSDGDGILDLGAAAIIRSGLGGSSSGTSSGTSSGVGSGTSSGTPISGVKNPFNVSTAPLGFAGSNNQRRNYQGEVWVWNDTTGWQIEGGFATFGGIISSGTGGSSGGNNSGAGTSTSSGGNVIGPNPSSGSGGGSGFNPFRTSSGTGSGNTNNNNNNFGGLTIGPITL